MRSLIWFFTFAIVFVQFESLAAEHQSDSLKQTDSLKIEYLVEQHLDAKQTSTAPELAPLGRLAVGVKTLSLTNPKQLSSSDFSSLVDRELKVEVWYPSLARATSPNAEYHDETMSGKKFALHGVAQRNAEPTKVESAYPLVVISHGYTGYRTMMYYLAEHLASHGYIVAAIDHTDSTNADVDFSADSGSGFASTLYNRARDQQYVLEALNAKDSAFSTIINNDSAAIIGYSMGGYGAINTVGGCYQFSPDLLSGLGFPKELASALPALFNTCSAATNATDTRWKAMISFAPWGGEQGVHKADSLGKITVPSLFVAGEKDDVSGFENGVRKLFQQIGSKSKYMLVYENARHNIAAHPAPQVAYENDLDIGHYFEPSWNSETIAQINKHMVIAFLNCHLKQQPTACNYLPKRNSAEQTKSADGSLTKPWPGFTDRWGLGMRFLRGKSSR